MAQHMDLQPNQLVRLVQLGHTERAARSEAVWQCVSCQTCTARCPQSVDCAGVMDALREYSLAEGHAASSQQRMVLFHKAFLSSVRRNGRVDELELIGTFKTRAFFADFNVPLLLKDATLGPQLVARGKLKLRGARVHDRDVVRRIFERCGANNL